MDDATTAIRVVLGEDDAAVRAMLADVLAESGFDVVGVGADGREALELALALTPDAVLLDVRMPQLSGIEAARAIRAAGRKVRIVMHSAYDDASLRAEAAEAGADAYLVKGAALPELAAALRGH